MNSRRGKKAQSRPGAFKYAFGFRICQSPRCQARHYRNQAAPNLLDKSETDPLISEKLASCLASWNQRDFFPLVIVVDDSDFASATFENFLWVAFTRSDPSVDISGANAKFSGKHWHCESPMIIDAKIKKFMPPVLEEDPEMIRQVENLAAKGGPLHGIF